MYGSDEVKLRQEIGELDYKTVMRIDENLYQEFEKIQEMIEEYNENVELLHNHALQNEIIVKHLKCQLLNVNY